MSKRKHDALEALEAANPSGTTSAKRQRKTLLAALENGKKALFRALRFARGFERQKLGRRQKSSLAKKGGADNERLAAEVEALKKLDLADLADTFLCRFLIKTKAIAEHSGLPQEVRIKATKPVSQEKAYGNVTGRMYTSKPVTDVLEQVLGTVRRTLGLREEEVKTRKRMRKADYEAAAKVTQQENNPPATAGRPGTDEDKKTLDSDAELHEDESFDGLSEDGQTEMANYLSASDDETGLGLGQFDSRLASSSDEDGSDSDEEPNPYELYAERSNRSKHSPELSASPTSDSVSVSSTGSADLRSRRARAPKSSKVSQSAFLPALASGYISGSDSEASDVSVTAAPRKNRMGQRARQALWERKFGNDAKHLTTGKKAPQGRDGGWDARRGATDGDQRKPWEKRKRGGISDRAGPGGPDKPQQVPEKAPNKVPTYGTEHPSWIARQTAEKKASLAAKPSGKKITFD